MANRLEPSSTVSVVDINEWKRFWGRRSGLVLVSKSVASRLIDPFVLENIC